MEFLVAARSPAWAQCDFDAGTCVRDLKQVIQPDPDWRTRFVRR